ncbi:acyl-CoA desaturase [Thaumasiovibrio sp. DFM-14]|uniref:acyl-CoA desaturase n=1 Tax=Thaumasiovibrio sp. DFM-14 TaxID=3384792 RepID=UPI00399F1ED8
MEMNHKPPLIWVNVALFSATLIVSLLLVPWYGIQYGYSWPLWFLFAFSYCLCGLSITAGYHRLWSHRSYNAHVAIRVIYALGGAFALQNSILHWCSDHRVHHKHVDDSVRDPYAASRGLWFSHIGWMLREYEPERYNDYTNCRDIAKDPIVQWQHKYYLLLVLLTNIGLPFVIGFLVGDIWGSLLLIGVARLFLSHHTTFFINSLAHYWGSQPYTDRNSARDNPILALLTFGEGYHNFHHLFENDYRNGFRWWQFDPTKWLINTLHRLTLASDLRRTPADRIEKMRVKQTMVKVRVRLEQQDKATRLLIQLQQEYEQLLLQISVHYVARKSLIAAKKNQLKSQYCQLEQQYVAIKKQLAVQRRRWKRFTTKYA